MPPATPVETALVDVCRRLDTRLGALSNLVASIESCNDRAFGTPPQPEGKVVGTMAMPGRVGDLMGQLDHFEALLDRLENEVSRYERLV